MSLSVVSCTPSAKQVSDVPQATPSPDVEVIDDPSKEPNLTSPDPGKDTPTPIPEPTDDPSEKETPSPAPRPAEVPSDKQTPVPGKETGKPSDAGWEKIVIPDEIKSLIYYYPDNYERYARYKAIHQDHDFNRVILDVNIGLDWPFYEGIREISRPDRIDVLVNKYNKLPDDFKPQLEELPSSVVATGVGRQYLRKEAKEAFIKMHDDARLLGLNITAYGTYRSIKTQNDIWNRKVKSGRTIEDVDRLNARGGHSEHHTGLAVDVIKNDYSTENSREYEWYKSNAHLYGFIIRYPKGKENITGYSYEPWHLRYLGPELATKVYESGLTYEEYYAINIEPYLSQ